MTKSFWKHWKRPAKTNAVPNAMGTNTERSQTRKKDVTKHWPRHPFGQMTDKPIIEMELTENSTL